MNYVVGIPTCNRPQMLRAVLDALKSQTITPRQIIVVNHNDNGAPVQIDAQHHDLVVTLKNPHAVHGPEQGHQLCLQHFQSEAWEIAVRWDDDLVPEPTCMERLLRRFTDPQINAVGGCYPRHNDDRLWPSGPHCKGAIPPNGDRDQIQFFRWQPRGLDQVSPWPTRSLYSSFAYRVSRMMEVGGFCTDYSKLGYRGETDASLRLGGCLIDPGAAAIHWMCAGGTRSIQDRWQMEQSDEQLFRRRMAQAGIDLSEGYQ